MKISREVLYLIVGSACLTAAPVFQVARENEAFLDWHDLGVTLLVVAGMPSLLIAILALSFPRRLSIAAAVTLTIWLSAYHIEMAGVLRAWEVPVVSEAGVVAVLVLSFPFLLFVLALLPRDFIARVIGAVGLALFALASIPFALSVGVAEFMEPAIDPTALIESKPLPEPAQAAGRLPDIIYIVPDRYASASVLAKVFQHDNSEFLNALRRRGFAVADKARANYLSTHYSLASSMNMQYLGPVLQSLDGRTTRAAALYSLIGNNLVAARLKKMGYRYIHVGSWWDGTRRNAHADLNVYFGVPNFAGELGQAVLVRSPIIRLAIASLNPVNRCQAIKQKLAYLEEIRGADRPIFVFAHVLVPHLPIVIDADGRCISPIDYPLNSSWETFTKAYSGFVTYLNKRLLQIFDRQKTNNPNPLIFVLQADEGPYPKAYGESDSLTTTRGHGTAGISFDWRAASDSELATKFGILNALYLGDPNGSEGLPEIPATLTPVNNWRVIFGKLDGRAYPLLPDRHFIYPTNDQPYTSIEITERLNAAAQ